MRFAARAASAALAGRGRRLGEAAEVLTAASTRQGTFRPTTQAG
jgi:hypothetical protein